MTNDAIAALELLRQGLKERDLLLLDVDYTTLVKTVLVIVDNNRHLRDRLQELSKTEERT